MRGGGGVVRGLGGGEGIDGIYKVTIIMTAIAFYTDLFVCDMRQ